MKSHDFFEGALVGMSAIYVSQGSWVAAAVSFALSIALGAYASYRKIFAQPSVAGVDQRL